MKLADTESINRLVRACDRGEYEHVPALLRELRAQGFSLNAESDKRFSALMASVSHPSPDPAETAKYELVFAILLVAGCDPDKTGTQFSAQDIITETNNTAAQEILDAWRKKDRASLSNRFLVYATILLEKSPDEIKKRKRSPSNSIHTDRKSSPRRSPSRQKHSRRSPSPSHERSRRRSPSRERTRRRSISPPPKRGSPLRGFKDAMVDVGFSAIGMARSKDHWGRSVEEKGPREGRGRSRSPRRERSENAPHSPPRRLYVSPPPPVLLPPIAAKPSTEIRPPSPSELPKESEEIDIKPMITARLDSTSETRKAVKEDVKAPTLSIRGSNASLASASRLPSTPFGPLLDPSRDDVKASNSRVKIRVDASNPLLAGQFKSPSSRRPTAASLLE